MVKLKILCGLKTGHVKKLSNQPNFPRITRFTIPKVVLGRLLYPLSLVLSWLILFIFIIFKIILSPILTIKIGNLFSLRIGHLVAENWIYALENSLEMRSKREVHVFFKNQKISNKYIYEWIITQDWSVPRIIIDIPILSKIFRISYYPHSYEPIWYAGKLFNKRLEVFENFNLVIENTLEMKDHSFLRFLVQKQNTKKVKFEFPSLIKNHEKTAILFYRNNDYLNSFAPNLYYQYRQVYNPRNNEWANFEFAVKYLIQKNYFVIRMGRFFDQVPFSHEMFYDYGGSKTASPEKDVEYCLNSDLVVTSLVGLDVLPIMWFDKPTLVLHSGEVKKLLFAGSNNSKIYYLPKVSIDTRNNGPFNETNMDRFMELYSQSQNHKAVGNLFVRKAIDQFLANIDSSQESCSERSCEQNSLFWRSIMKVENRDYQNFNNFEVYTTIDLNWLKLQNFKFL